MSVFLRFGIDLKWKQLILYVFENNRNSCLKNCGLWPSHYLSAPALNWDVMFNMTKVQLQPLSDAHMYLFFEKDMRGRVSYIS